MTNLPAPETRDSEVHSCSFYCDRPACIKAQRDQFRDNFKPIHEREPPHCPTCGCGGVRAYGYGIKRNGELARDELGSVFVWRTADYAQDGVEDERDEIVRVVVAEVAE